MIRSSTWEKVALAVGFVISFSAAVWLLSWPIEARPGTLPRLGFMSAVLCAFGSLVYCWVVFLAYVARKRHWSPRTCNKAGLSIIAVVAVLAFFAAPRARAFTVALAVYLSFITSYLCVRRVYPELSYEEVTAPEPPISLFPK
jgi:hypothetical protein